MSSLIAIPWNSATLPLLPMHRFSVEQYHRMIEAGVLNESHRVELLEGWIVSKMAHNPPHDGMIDIVVGEIEPSLPAGWFVRVQSAVTMDDSEPEPDIAVVRGPCGRYSKAHLPDNDIALVMDIADSTLHQDRNFKAAIYGKAGIPVYWIVNIPDVRVELHTDPSGPHQVRNYA